MDKKLFISLGFLAVFSASTICAMAHSTIYVDEIGRLHFLGKDPGSKANYTQQMGNFNNPEQKDLTNIIYKNEQNQEQAVKNIENTVDETKKQAEETKVNSVEHTNKSKGSFTFSKGSMDASNPYTYGNTNIERGVNNSKTIYTDDLGRKHFFNKANQIKE